MHATDRIIAKLQSYLLNNREDEDSWLVLADALQDRGNPSGEMIVLEHRLSKERDEEIGWILAERYRELKDQSEAQLIGPLADIPGAVWEIRRGFLWHVEVGLITIEGLRKLVASPCFRMLASLKLEVTTKMRLESYLEVLAGLRLESLSLKYSLVGEKGAKALASSESLRNLTTLDLWANGIGEKGAKALSSSESLGNLTTLNLGANGIGEKGAKALASSESLINLTTLYLWGNGIGADGAKALASSESLGNLTTLNLWNNDIGDEGAKALASSESLGNLTTLNLGANGIGADGAKALASSESLINLTTLYLWNNGIGAEGKQALLQSAFLTDAVKEQIAREL
jgi:hypothetical protein